MSIHRSTLILAGALFVTASAFAGGQDNKRDKLEVIETYAGVDNGSMIPADTVSATTPVLPDRERGNLNK